MGRGQRKVEKERFIAGRPFRDVLSYVFSQVVEAIDDGKIGSEFTFSQVAWESLLFLCSIRKCPDRVSFDVDIGRKIERGGNNQ